MTKAELLTQLENDSLGVNTVEKVVASTNKAGEPVYDEGAFQNGKTYTKYNANVLVKDGESHNFVNIPFTVLNEGLAGEEAFLTQGIKEPKLDQVRKAVAAYMDSQGSVIRHTVDNVNETDRSARVTAIIDNGDGTATEQNWLVYKNQGSPVAHVNLV